MHSTNWNDATFHRFVKSIPSSTGVAEVVVHIEGIGLTAYLKSLGNPAGPHALACEWVGSRLAAWFGLSTFDFGIMEIEENDEIPLGDGNLAEPGPAFVSRSEPGEPWSGAPRNLESLVNPEDISLLVVFDTWTLNVDRFPPPEMQRNPKYDNVFLSDRDGIIGKHRLLAMDHTHCFTNGGEITSRIAGIDKVKDKRVYGLFRQFEPFLTARQVKEAAKKIRSVSTTLVEEILASVPSAWGVNRNGLNALRNLIVDRAQFLTDEVYDMLVPYCRMHDSELSWDGGNDNGGK